MPGILIHTERLQLPCRFMLWVMGPTSLANVTIQHSS